MNSPYASPESKESGELLSAKPSTALRITAGIIGVIAIASALFAGVVTGRFEAMLDEIGGVGIKEMRMIAKVIYGLTSLLGITGILTLISSFLASKARMLLLTVFSVFLTVTAGVALPVVLLNRVGLFVEGM